MRKYYNVAAQVDMNEIAQHVHEWDSVDDIINFILLILNNDEELIQGLKEELDAL